MDRIKKKVIKDDPNLLASTEPLEKWEPSVKGEPVGVKVPGLDPKLDKLKAAYLKAKAEENELYKAVTPSSEAPTHIVGGPFTRESIKALFYAVNKAHKLSYYERTQDLTQKQLNWFNQKAAEGGFDDENEWWKNGFTTVFGCSGSPLDSGTAKSVYPYFQAFNRVARREPVVAGELKQPDPQTQKAKGIRLLSSYASKYDAHFLPFFHISNPLVVKISDGKLSTDEIEAIWSKACEMQTKNQIFARCCPMFPRHGFTDSIFLDVKVDGKKEFFNALSELCSKMLKDDEKGEMVLMKPILASHNVVANQGSLTIGLKHDGATGGKNTFTLPMASKFKWADNEKEALGIGKTDDVFAEFVYLAGNTYITQLRGGPSISHTGDYIPRQVKLDPNYEIPSSYEKDGEKIEYVDTEWEHLIRRVKEKPDWDKFYVLHEGGAISSHFGIHCYINEIPYITSQIKKRDGLFRRTVLEPNVGVQAEPDFEALLNGLKKGLHAVRGCQEAQHGLNVTLAALHNYPALDLSIANQAEFFGFANGICTRLCLAACLGEFRYAKRFGFDHIRGVSHHNYTREDVYLNCFKHDLNYLLYKAYVLEPLFGYPGWDVGSGVGGANWLNCSYSSFRHWNAICKFVESPSKSSVKQITNHLNKVINVCHNGGKMLTKFGNGFDHAAHNPYLFSLQHLPEIYDLLRKRVSNQNDVRFVPFDLDPEKWDFDVIKRRRYSNWGNGTRFDKNWIRALDSDGLKVF